MDQDYSSLYQSELRRNFLMEKYFKTAVFMLASVRGTVYDTGADLGCFN